MGDEINDMSGFNWKNDLLKNPVLGSKQSVIPPLGYYQQTPEYGEYLKAQTNLVNKQLAGMDKFGWSDFSNIMGGLSSAANAYTGLRGLSMARNQFNEQSALNRANYSNQAKMLNEQLALKARRTGRAPITLSETY